MDERASFFTTLMSTPAEGRSRLSRFVSVQGCVYMAAGLFMMFSPSALLTVVNGLPVDGQALFRLCGFSMTVIGWFYFMGGRTGASSFALATVADRAVVPFACAAFVLFGGLTVQLVAPIAIADMVLGFLTWRVWRTEAVNP